MDAKESEEIYKAFKSAFNMSPAKLQRWLETEESKAVGWKEDSGSGESIGHHSGRRIVEIKRKRRPIWRRQTSRTCGKWSATSIVI